MVAYTVVMRDHPGRPYSQLWVMDVATRKASRLGDDNSVAGSPRWSHDGKWLSFTGTDGKQAGLWIVRPDGSDATFLAPMTGSNSPLPGQGDNTSWSPDSKQIAFVSSAPGPETADATGDPVVITRYLYRPTASEGFTHFNDNRRLHIFIGGCCVEAGEANSPTVSTTSTRSPGRPTGRRSPMSSNPDPNDG